MTKASLPATWTVALATGFGLGLSPFASGTVGSLLGPPIVWALSRLDSLVLQIFVAATLALLAIPVCDVAEKHLGKKDDGRIVADEFLTFPLCMLGLPLSPWWVLPMCFITNRFFDILKLPPAHQLQRVKGGMGIVLDDVFASLYALATNHLLFHLLVRA